MTSYYPSSPLADDYNRRLRERSETLTCTVLVGNPDMRGLARCGNTASYKLVNGVDLVCGFHRDGAVRLIPSSASHFERL